MLHFESNMLVAAYFNLSINPYSTLFNVNMRNLISTVTIVDIVATTFFVAYCDVRIVFLIHFFTQVTVWSCICGIHHLTRCHT